MAFGDESDPFLIKQNDTRPRLRYYAKQGPANALLPISMVDATAVVFNMRRAEDPDTIVVSRGTAEFLTPATAGGLQYTFTGADTGTPTSYLGEFEITFSDGGVLTVPTGDNWIHITVGDDIA